MKATGKNFGVDLKNFQTAVKSCKTMGKNLSDMTKELEAIAATGSVSDLPEKLTEAEEAKVEVEAMILERVSFNEI